MIASLITVIMMIRITLHELYGKKHINHNILMTTMMKIKIMIITMTPITTTTLPMTQERITPQIKSKAKYQ